MDRFMVADRIWPRGWTRLHVYLLPDYDADPTLGVLMDACNEVVARYDFIAPMDRRWAHTTVQMIGGLPASDVSPSQRDALVAALRTELADVAPFVLSCGSPMASSVGVLLDQDGDDPDGPFSRVFRRVRAAVSSVLGPASIEYDTMPPHLGVGYARAGGDSGKVQSALRRHVRPSHAPMTVRAVWLLDVTQDTDECVYRWTEVARIDLAG